MRSGKKGIITMLITGSYKRREARQSARSQAVAHAEQIFQQMLPDFANRKVGASVSQKECMALMEKLREEIDPSQLKSVRIFIRRRIEKISEQAELEAFLPPREIYIRRDASPFANDAFHLVKRLSRLRNAFKNDVCNDLPQSHGQYERGPDEKALEIALGRVMFSAIVYGGLLIRAHTRQLLMEVFGDGLSGHDDCVWVSFADPGLDYQQMDLLDAPVRRWFLDPVTLGLVVHIKTGPLAERITTKHLGRPYQYLSKYLRLLDKSTKTYPEEKQLNWSVSLLIKASRANLSLSMPQPLVRFLGSKAEGQSMSERTWWRYKYDRVLPKQQEEEEDGSLTNLVAASTERVDYKYKGNKKTFFKRQEQLLRALRQCLFISGKSDSTATNAAAARAIDELVETHKEEMAPMLMAYSLWLKWKLTLTSTHEGRIRTVSARRYTSRLGHALISLGAEMDIDEANSDDWSEFYVEVIESLSTNRERNKAVGNLKQFHDFLMMVFDCPPASIGGQNRELSSCRATLVTEKDYQSVLASLDREGGHKLEMLRCILILAYRTGMRPKEIVSLEFQHIQGFEYFEQYRRISDVIIGLKSTSRKTLKTPSAVRQIPLRWFLTKEELEEVHTYLGKRLKSHKEGSPGRLVVFPKFPGELERVSQTEVFRLIGELLRQTTSDKLVVPYSLRHGFLSNLFLELMRPFGEKFPELRRGENNVYEAVYSISTLAGQLDPEISLTTYIHTQDYTAHLNICRTLHCDHPPKLWAALENISVASVERRIDRQDKKHREEHGWDNQECKYQKYRFCMRNYARLAKRLELKRPRSKRREKITLPSVILEERSIIDLDIAALYAMFCSMQRRHTNKARAELFGVPEEEVVNLGKWGLKLGAFKTSPPTGSESSRMLRKHPKGRKLPPVYQFAQPGSLAPAPPNYSRTEFNEANRVYQLIVRRARNAKDGKGEIREKIINPVIGILKSFSRTEAAARITSKEQLWNAVQTLRDLRIDQTKIQLEIESLPDDEAIDYKAWELELRKMSASHKLQMHGNNRKVDARSRKYPDFGIVRLQVLEAPKPRAGESISDARKRIGSKGGSGWRVGCYYALVAVSAHYWAA